VKIDNMSNQNISTVRASEGQNRVLQSTEVEAVAQIDQSANMQDAIRIDTEDNDKLIDKSVEQANIALKAYDKVIERSVHEKTKTMMYVLKDTKTDEVIREFPPKKIQDMIAKMWELAGLFVDEKA